MMVAVHEADRAHRDAGRIELDDQLRQAFVAIAAVGRGAAQHEERMRLVRPARPHFLSGHAPAVRHALGARFHRREIGTRVGLAHAEREIAFAARDRRQKALLLLFGAVAQQAGPGLAVAEPVRRARRRDREHFLGHDEALEIRALLAAVALGPRHADPAARRDPAREFGVELGVPETRLETRARRTRCAGIRAPRAAARARRRQFERAKSQPDRTRRRVQPESALAAFCWQ